MTLCGKVKSRPGFRSERSQNSFPCLEVVISEVQTKTSGILNPSMCTRVQILQAEPSVSVYLTTCQQHYRVKLEEIFLQLPQKCRFLQLLKSPKGWCYRSGKAEMT